VARFFTRTRLSLHPMSAGGSPWRRASPPSDLAAERKLRRSELCYNLRVAEGRF
jgi:hypothetical protein